MKGICQQTDGVGTRGLEGLSVGAAAHVEVHLPPGAMPSGLAWGTIELCAWQMFKAVFAFFS